MSVNRAIISVCNRKGYMGFFSKTISDSEKKGLDAIRLGIEEYKKALSEEENRLEELFSALKTDAVEALTHSLSLERVTALHRQVRHVISVARMIGYKELESSFSQEEKILTYLEDLLHTYPAQDLLSSSDVHSAIRRLTDMISLQQKLIFRHKDILLQEKQRLVDLLSEAARLEEEFKEDHSLHIDAPNTMY